MAEYDNTNRGVLFKNDRRENDKQPTHRGTLNVKGVDHYLSAWVSTTNSGQPVMRLSLGDVKAEQQSKPAPRAAAGFARPAPARAMALDDEVPF